MCRKITLMHKIIVLMHFQKHIFRFETHTEKKRTSQSLNKKPMGQSILLFQCLVNVHLSVTNLTFTK